MKSNAIAGGILAAAISVSATLGLFAPLGADASDRVLRRAVTELRQTVSDDRPDASSGSVYATFLSSGSSVVNGVQLSSSSLSSDVRTLPQEVKEPDNAPTVPVSIQDPIVQERFAEEEAIARAEAEAEVRRLAEEEAARKVAAGFVDPKSFARSDVYIDVSGGVWNDGFVFDINQTVYPVTEEEVEMLKYVVQAEAGDGSLESKRIVTFSIVNRMASPSFPYSSLYDVLHARNQFSTISNYYTKKRIPDENTIRAVEEVLMGACEDNSQGCLYFYDASYPVAEKVRNWFENDLVYLFTIGTDRFFRDP